MRDQRLDQVLFYAHCTANDKLEICSLSSVQSVPASWPTHQPSPQVRCWVSSCCPAFVRFVGVTVQVQKWEPGKYRYKYFLQLGKKRDCRIDGNLLHLILVPFTLAAALSVTRLCSISIVRLIWAPKKWQMIYDVLAIPQWWWWFANALIMQMGSSMSYLTT